MAIRAMSAGAANAVSKDCPPKMPAAPAPGGRYQISEAHRKECSMFMTDFWALIKLTFERENTDQYWSELVRLADSLGRKYYGNRFAYSMIMAYVDYHSNQAKEENRIRKEAG